MEGVRVVEHVDGTSSRVKMASLRVTVIRCVCGNPASHQDVCVRAAKEPEFADCKQGSMCGNAGTHFNLPCPQGLPYDHSYEEWHADEDEA